MAARVYETQITVAAGTPQATPAVQTWVTEDNLIETVELNVPPGHNGLTGIRLMKGDVSLLPYNSASFIVANNYFNTFYVNDYIPTRDVTIQAFNTGAYPHTFYLRMTISDYDTSGGKSSQSESNPLPFPAGSAFSDPLSPAAILGPDVANALTTGDITSSDVAPMEPTPVNVPPEPQPTGL